MGKFLIVSRNDKLREYKEIAERYNLGYEINDFYMPNVLTDKKKQQTIIDCYREIGMPDYCTMHGAFVDVLIFSYDEEIRAIARKRIIESMDIAKNIGAKAVIFHTNANPFLAYGEYKSRMINCTVEILREMLEQYSNINIYMENMFDSNPDILLEISEKLLEYDNYGVCFDYAHASISKTPVEKWIICLKRYIKHIHINDNDLINDLHLAVGDGKIDWEQFFTYYKKYFQDCTVLIETTSPKNQIRSVEFLKKHISIQ